MVGAADLGVDAPELARKVFDHAVGVGMIDVKAVQFAVGRQIDSCIALGGEDNAGGIHEGLFVRVGGKPIGNGIGTNGGNLDAWSAHNN